ncbi:glycoside hydrolase family 57 protein [Prevotellamassilia timonensis]|uniref:glycoside hydrolase family 57 protein n=1 Tax=Prevotellamassilia timonensis TaxID=1852370 RepID=UPI001F3CB6E9|nr:glycoside hydrolase family 57 protein [Prevotellamassilia timonensis]MCF2635651.1 glycoside hydrolase family 57 protein [Prevotellamassilia timonensis]
MKTVCLYFEIHQNIHLKRYRFFDIGTDHYYYDDYENARSITETAERSYVPAIEALLEMADAHPGYFKCAISLSGCAIEQLENHAPQVIELLQQLNEKGCVEFLAEPYSHGFSSLKNPETFRDEVQRLCAKVKALFGKEPKIFRNSALIYSDEIGELVASMGFKGMLAEGAKHVLGWKSPHFVYHCNRNPKLKLLLRDYSLSEDISFRFNDSSWSEYPLFADTYANWIGNLPEEEQVVNIFMELCALGIFQPLSSNILEFMKALPAQFKERGIIFSTPSEICSKMKSAGELTVTYPTSWVDEERDLSPWLGNVMQREAIDKLYSIADRVRICRDRRLMQDFDYLQASNNLRFMSTKPNSYGGYRGIYDSPYDAFTNYMNILGDFITRVNDRYPLDIDNEELNSLLTTIKNQGDELELKEKEISKLQNMLARFENKEAASKAEKKVAKKAAPKAEKAEKAPKAEKAEKAEKKPAAKKPAAKKAAPKKAE